MARILVTNGGSHPPEKWAMTTAEQVFDIGSSVAGDRLIQAQKLQLAIAEALMPHYSQAQDDETSRLAEDAKNVLSSHSVDAYLDAAMKDVVGAAKGTMWESHFADPDVQAAAREVIGSNFTTAMHVERLWHADRNPDCEFAQSYRAQFGA